MRDERARQQEPDGFRKRHSLRRARYHLGDGVRILSRRASIALIFVFRQPLAEHALQPSNRAPRADSRTRDRRERGQLACQFLTFDERPRVIDQKQMPVVVIEKIAGVAIDVGDQLIEHPHAAHASRPSRPGPGRRLLDVPRMRLLDPIDERPVHGPSYARRPAAPCAFRACDRGVGGDLRLVALVITLSIGGRERLPGGAPDQATRLKYRALRLGHADRDVFELGHLGRSKECLDLRFLTHPCQ